MPDMSSEVRRGIVRLRDIPEDKSAHWLRLTSHTSDAPKSTSSPKEHLIDFDTRW